jgi:hypothetical protein
VGRTPIRPIDRPRSRSAVNALFFLGIALVLVFAAIGVASAGNFVADKVRTSSPTPRASPPSPTTGRSAAVQELRHASAQATAIVNAAISRSRAIVAAATRRARRRALSIQSSSRSIPGTRPISTVGPTQIPAPATTPQPIAVSSPQAGQGASPAPPPDLSGVPTSWLVVGYDVTFGHGPGTAGSISVLNRSKTMFSGVARVTYFARARRSAIASATFTGLAPGQSEVLPLNGPTYSGSGYVISLANLH